MCFLPFHVGCPQPKTAPPGKARLEYFCTLLHHSRASCPLRGRVQCRWVLLEGSKRASYGFHRPEGSLRENDAYQNGIMQEVYSKTNRQRRGLRLIKTTHAKRRIDTRFSFLRHGITSRFSKRNFVVALIAIVASLMLTGQSDTRASRM